MPKLENLEQKASSKKAERHTLRPRMEKSELKQVKIFDSYMEMPLEGHVSDHVEQAKNWLKANRLEGRNIIKITQQQVNKALRQGLKLDSVLDLSSRDGHSLSKILYNSKQRPMTTKIFNVGQLEGQIKNQIKSRAQSHKKLQHTRKINNYLGTISKLRKHTEVNQTYEYLPKQYNNSFANCQIQQTKESNLQQCKQNSFRNPIQECTGLYNGYYQSETNRSKGIQKQKLVAYHPFLERNLEMLYTPKRKKFIKSSAYFLHQK